MCKVNVTYIIKKRNWKLMQIRPLCGHYTRVNIPLEGEKYDVFLTLPYQINSLPGHVRLLTMYKHCKNKLESKCC